MCAGGVEVAGEDGSGQNMYQAAGLTQEKCLNMLPWGGTLMDHTLKEFCVHCNTEYRILRTNTYIPGADFQISTLFICHYASSATQHLHTPCLTVESKTPCWRGRQSMHHGYSERMTARFRARQVWITLFAWKGKRCHLLGTNCSSYNTKHNPEYEERSASLCFNCPFGGPVKLAAKR